MSEAVVSSTNASDEFKTVVLYIYIGPVIVVIIICFIIWMICRHKKKKEESETEIEIPQKIEQKDNNNKPFYIKPIQGEDTSRTNILKQTTSVMNENELPNSSNTNRNLINNFNIDASALSV